MSRFNILERSSQKITPKKNLTQRGSCVRSDPALASETVMKGLNLAKVEKVIFNRSVTFIFFLLFKKNNG